ncbi:recombinase family protein [Aeromonas veronii]|uniref:recombinase family protein n=1 Tax=Aeromonas veronii TaxID=654 RepID=UPI003D1BA6AC
MPIAYSYIRFSTARQGAEGKHSHQRQTDRAEQWCSENGYTLAKESYKDLGVSAWHRSSKRDGLTALLDAVSTGKIPTGSVILLDSLDRLSRAGIAETRGLIQRIVSAGVSLVDLMTATKIDSSSLNDLTADIQIGLSAWLSWQESEKKSQRVLAARAAAAKRAKKGEQIKRRLPFWLSLIDGQALINDQGAVVKRMVDMRLCGYGLTGIAKVLNSEMYQSPNNKGWSDQTVRYVLENPALYGCYRQKDGTEIDGYYPAVITKSEYLEIKPMRGKRSAALAPKSPINGITRCACCGRSLKRVESKKNGLTFVYYTCRGRINGVCDLRPWRDLDKHIRDAVKYLSVPNRQTNDHQQVATRRAEIDHRIAELEAGLSRGLAVTAILDAISSLQAERHTLVDARQVDQQDVVKLTECSDPVGFNLLLRKVVKSISVHKGRCEIIRHDGLTINMLRGGVVVGDVDRLRDHLNTIGD